MRRPSPRDLLFACVIVLFALHVPTAVADPGDRVKEMIESMPSKYSDAHVDVRSDAEIDARAMGQHVANAYDFDRNLLGWTNDNALEPKVTVGLASEDAIKRYMNSTMGGRAVGDDMFASHADIYNQRPDFAWFVTAHELQHLQMHRVGAKEPGVPVYVFEGLACAVGDRYVGSTIGQCQYLRSAKKTLSNCKQAEAMDVIRNFRDPSSIAEFKAGGMLWKGEHLGGLFIENTRRMTMLSDDDFFRAFGRVCRDVAHGEKFDAAFYKRFGITLKNAEASFIAMMDDNADTSARFQGTVFDTGH